MNEVVINTYLAGVRRFLASAKEEAVAITEIGMATRAAGIEMATTRRQGFLMNQTLFTMRRILYGTTLVVLGAGVAALKMGNDYNNAMQTARVALQPFIGDNRELQSVLDQLWQIAKFTPFQIKDMTLAFRYLYPAMKTTGASADDVVESIRDITNLLSVAGKVTPAALQRVAYGLQHMAFQGRLTGRTVQQLAAEGIPIFAILSKEMGLTGDQLHNIAQLGIPARDVLEAIHRYVRDPSNNYANAARRQSLMTLNGLWSTFKDNVSQTMGLAEKGWFKSFQRLFVRMNSFFNDLQANQRRTHNLMRALDMTLTPQSHTIINLWDRVRQVFQDFWKALKMVFTLIITNKWVWVGLAIAMGAVGAVMHVLVATMNIWGPILTVIIPLLVLQRLATLALVGANIALEASIGAVTFVTGVYRAAVWLVNGAIMAWITAERILQVLQTGSVRGMDGRFIKMTRLEKLLMRMRTVVLRQAIAWGILDASMELNPYVLLATAIIAVIAAATLMMVKFKEFDAFIHRHNWILYLMAVLSPFLFTLYEVRKHWDDIAYAIGRVAAVFRRAFGWIINSVKQLVHWLKEAYRWTVKLLNFGVNNAEKQRRTGQTFWGGNWNPLNWGGSFAHAIGLQHGGTVTRSGMVTVGERGPELLHLPRGAAVEPLHLDRSAPQIITINLRSILHVDGRKMAEAVARHQTSVNARL